jgi:hypothetical protein
MFDEPARRHQSARRCGASRLCKMKREYDRLQPDAGPDECWAEAEALDYVLEPFELKE